MPEINPDLTLQLARRVVQIYGDAQAVMMEKVARRLARGIEEEGWAEKKRSQTRQLRGEALAEVQRLEREGPAAVERALTTGFDSGVKAAKSENVVEISGAFIGQHRAALDALVKETVTAIRSTHLGILRSSLDGYRAVISEASLPGIVTGTETRREAAQRALDRFARQGITGFTDRAGRRWRLESYVEMATRTGSGHAMLEGRLQTYQAAGRDLVIVSDAPEECPVCRPFEGQVLSISGADKDHQSLASARAAGLFHPGCRHDLRPYIPGLTKRFGHTADEKGSDQRVRQRALERRVRERKRQDIAARAWASEDDSPAARLKAKQARRKLDKAKTDLTGFITANDRKRLRYREQVGKAI